MQKQNKQKTVDQEGHSLDFYVTKVEVKTPHDHHVKQETDCKKKKKKNQFLQER